MGDLTYRLRKRAEIRRNATSRKSVQEGSPDRISDLLEEAANEIENIKNERDELAVVLRLINEDAKKSKSIIAFAGKAFSRLGLIREALSKVEKK